MQEIINNLSNLEPKILVIAAALIIVLSYIIYQLIDSTKNVKKDKIVQSSKHMEKQIEAMIQVDKIKIFKKYRNITKELLPSDMILNIYLIVILALVGAYAAYEYTSTLLNQVVAGILVAIMAFVVPFVILDILVAIKRKNMRRHLPNFLLMFQQTYSVTGDSIQTLMTIRNDIREPIKGYIKELLKNVSKGVEHKEAIEILKSRSENEVLWSFADNILTDMEYGKMIETELQTDILQAYTHEENFNQRITENTGNVISIIAVLALFAESVRRMIGINDEFFYILTNNSEGKLAVNAVLVIIMIVFYLVKTSLSYKDQ